jgi:hypothetical protein
MPTYWLQAGAKKAVVRPAPWLVIAHSGDFYLSLSHGLDRKRDLEIVSGHFFR